MDGKNISTSFRKEDTLKTKALAVILLLFHHLYYIDNYINTYNIRIPFFLELGQLLRAGMDARVCVWIFAFLSAYGVTTKLYQKVGIESTARTIFRQWWSLMKPYWFVYAVCSLLFAESIYKFHNRDLANIIVDFFGCTELFGLKSWMGSWWYMCFAQVLLFVLPLLISLVEKTGIFSIPLCYLLINYVSPGIRSEAGGYYSASFYAVLFAILCVSNNWYGMMKKRDTSIIRFVEAVALFTAFLLFAHWKVSLSYSAFKGVATIASALSVVSLCIFVQKYITISWIERLLVFIGKHSGNIYLIHAFVYSRLSQIVFFTKSVLGSVIILLGICVMISILCEKVKKCLQYDKIMNRVLEKILI